MIVCVYFFLSPVSGPSLKQKSMLNDFFRFVIWS